MRKLLFFGLLLIGFSAKSQVGTIKHLDEKNGFAGITLGDTITNIKLKTTPDIGSAKDDKYGVATYVVTADSLLNIGNEVPLNAISISFLDNKVYSINLYFNPADQAKVHAALIKAYGKPNKVTATHSPNWVGQRVSLVYSVNKAKKDKHISFNSIILNNLFESRYNTSVKKTSSDL